MGVRTVEEHHSFRWGSFANVLFGIAKVGSIGYSPYFEGFNNESAAIPKKVWKTSTVLPGRSLIPPSYGS